MAVVGTDVFGVAFVVYIVVNAAAVGANVIGSSAVGKFVDGDTVFGSKDVGVLVSELNDIVGFDVIGIAGCDVVGIVGV